MKKLATLFLVLLLTLATASVASADILDPGGGRPPRPPRPPGPAVEAPKPPQVEVTARREGTITDGFKIRKCATENNVTTFTSLDTVRALLDVLDETTLRISTIDA